MNTNLKKIGAQIQNQYDFSFILNKLVNFALQVAATIDKWSTNIVNIKKVSKVSRDEDEDN